MQRAERALDPSVQRHPRRDCRTTAGQVAVPQGHEHAERHGDEHEAQHDRLLGIDLVGDVDRQGHGLGAAGEVAGERDRGAELTECPGPRQHGAGDQAGTDGGQGHPPEHVPAGRPEGAGGVLEAHVLLAERCLDGDHEEGHGDEGLGHDDAGGRERQREPEPLVQVLPDQPAPPERVEQGDATDDRGQDHRQGAAGPAPRRVRELHPRQDPRQGHAEPDGGDGRPQRAPQRQAQRRQGAVGGEDRPGVTPWRPPEQPEERQREEGRGDAGQDEGDEGQSRATSVSPLAATGGGGGSAAGAEVLTELRTRTRRGSPGLPRRARTRRTPRRLRRWPTPPRWRSGTRRGR